MEQKQSYLLKMMFNKKQITKENLEKEYIQNKMKPNISEESTDVLVLSIEGTLDEVDLFHCEISKFIKKKDLDMIRIADEAGDYVRQLAYPILAEIEQRFRTFINQVLVETEGFSWWTTFTPKSSTSIREKADSIHEKSKKEKNMAIHPLECTTFENLRDIIDVKISEISDTEQLTVKKFKELLSDCNSIQDVQIKLDKKTREITYWNEVFSHYFEKKQWDDLKKDLTYILEVRNKVMHHRPLYYGAVKDLEIRRTEILSILDSAKKELTKEQLQQIKELQQHVTQILTQYQASINKAMESVSQSMESVSQYQASINKAMESVSQYAEIIKFFPRL